MLQFLLIGVGWLASAPAAGEIPWHETLTPHFHIRHQMSRLPAGLTMGLERLHGRLRLDLAMFSPWMSAERLNLYLYEDKESYVAGEFSPPAWSNGLSLYEPRVVAVFDQPRPEKLLEVIAHETTHLLFESYWGEAGRQPPDWLNEGLAMLEESGTPQAPHRSPWYAVMVGLPSQRMFAMDDFLRLDPIRDLEGKTSEVQTFYTQAYAVSYYLFRKKSRLQFKGFCSHLRDGKDVREALWLSYRVGSLPKFDRELKAWLQDPSHQALLATVPQEGAEPGPPLWHVRGFDKLSKSPGQARPRLKPLASPFAGGNAATGDE